MPSPAGAGSLTGSVMSESATIPDGKAHPTTRSKRVLEFVALCLFLAVGSAAAAPCLCIEGEIRGRYTMALLGLAFCRLVWSVYRGTFRYREYFLYLAVVIGFCVWADLQVGHPS